MHLKFALLFVLFFVGIYCFRHVGKVKAPTRGVLVPKVKASKFDKNNENDKMNNDELTKKVKIIEEKFVEVSNKLNEKQKTNIKTMLDIVKRLIDGNVENMSEQLSVVQNAAAALYETFMPNKLNYEATTINEEKLNNQTFLNQILYNLLKGVEEGSEVDNETMATAIAIWEYFIFKFEIPSNTECNSDMNTSGKKKHAYSFNKKQSQNRHKRAPCDCPPETLIEICMNIVFFVLLMMVFLPKVHIDYYLP